MFHCIHQLPLLCLEPPYIAYNGPIRAFLPVVAGIEVESAKMKAKQNGGQKKPKQ